MCVCVCVSVYVLSQMVIGTDDDGDNK